MPHTGRFAVEDDTFPDGTRVKAGDHVRYVQYYLHRNARYWDKPDEFIPGMSICGDFVNNMVERWNDKNILQTPFQYMPFHAGQTQCRSNPCVCLSLGIGRHMAVIEAKILLGQIYSRYRLEVLDGPEDITPFFGVVMPIQGGLHVKVVSLDRQ